MFHLIERCRRTHIGPVPFLFFHGSRRSIRLKHYSFVSYLCPIADQWRAPRPSLFTSIAVCCRICFCEVSCLHGEVHIIHCSIPLYRAVPDPSYRFTALSRPHTEIPPEHSGRFRLNCFNIIRQRVVAEQKLY